MNAIVPTSAPILERVRSVPSRLVPALLTFGGLLGMPCLLVGLAILFFAVDVPVAGVATIVIAGFAFVAATILALTFIFRASSRLARAEQALFAGDFETATREALFVTRTVFRSDYQTGALFTLALSAERIGAFPEAAALFARALDMIPAMAAGKPGRRARALFSAHAAIDFAAANDGPKAHAMLSRCFAALGQSNTGGAFDVLLDDSYMGAVGINTLLVTLENRRDPRPLAVLATMLLAFKDGQLDRVLHAFAAEQQAILGGLAPHERALAERLHGEALRLASSAGPHRSPGNLALAGNAGAGQASEWALLVVPPNHR